VLESLRNDPDGAIVKLYKLHRNEFLSWAYKQFGASAEVSSDCFQDALIILYKNIKDRKLQHLSSEVKTYLFSIGKNLVLRAFHEKKKSIPIQDAMLNTNAQEVEFPELFSGNLIENKIADIVKTLGDPCRSILKYFYFRGFSMEEIADKLSYKNAQTVKAQKVRCIKEIKALVNRKSRTQI